MIKERLEVLFEGLNWTDRENEDEEEEIAGSLLWIILSALRGPDDDNSCLKFRTTLRLRMAVATKFFNLDGINDEPLPDKPQPNETCVDFRYRVHNEIKMSFPDSQEHFLSHYLNACWVYWKVLNS